MIDFLFGNTVLVLTPGQQSQPQDFTSSVPNDTDTMCLRIIALWRDNQALGANPTIEIKSGQGGFIKLNVTPQGSPTRPVDIIGTGGHPVGTATCERDDADVFLIRLFNIAIDQGPWNLRITNNDQDTLGFVAVAVSSGLDTEALQPWVIWGATPSSFTTVSDPRARNFRLKQQFDTHRVWVRNLGTAPLIFQETAGPIPPPDANHPDTPASPLFLVTLPQNRLIDIHGIDQVVFGVNPDGALRTATVNYTIHTNDTYPPHTVAAVTVTVEQTIFPAPGLPCQVSPDGHCPGFVDKLNSGVGVSDDDVCVQPGCGHMWDLHNPPPPPPPPSGCCTCGCPAFMVGRVPHSCARQGCWHDRRVHVC
jgi:hypothetical protein